MRVLAAWVCHLRGRGAPVADVAADEFVALAAGDLDDAVGRVLGRLGVDDPQVRAAAAGAGPRARALTMLRPQESPTRDRRSLAGLWRFRADPDGVGREQEWFAAPLADAIDMPVPASYNDIVPGRELHDHVGEVWYQTRVRVPHTWGDQRIVLRFDSATHRATVWVDGHELVQHEGGYTPFEADVTDLVRAGAEVLVTAAVDNVLTWETIPPGIVVDTPRGRRQKYMHDFFNYAGLHRPVWLYATPRTYLDDLRVTTAVDDPLAEQVAATVTYRAEVAGDRPVTVRARLLDADGTERGTAEGAEGTIALSSAHLWRAGRGIPVRPGGRAGRRRRRAGGLLPPAGRHPDRRGPGHRVPHQRRRRSTSGASACTRTTRSSARARRTPRWSTTSSCWSWIGANSFRTSHYPYSEEILDYADAHGIVVIDETAAVGMNAGVAAVLGTRIDRVYGPEAISDRTAETHAQAIRELIARDKNRPSVGDLVDRQRARVAHRRRGPLLRAAVQAGPQPGRHATGRLRQRPVLPGRGVQAHAVQRRRHDQPLLRLVRRHR